MPKIELKNHYHQPCPRCGEMVAPGDNAVYFSVAYEAIMQGADPVEALKDFTAKPRPFGPVPQHIFGFGTKCKGSPSRIALLKKRKLTIKDGKRLPKEEWYLATPVEFNAAWEALRIVMDIVHTD